MEAISHIEIRQRYMQLSKALLEATEQGDDARISALAAAIKSLEPVLLRIESADAPDCP